MSNTFSIKRLKQAAHNKNKSVALAIQMKSVSKTVSIFSVRRTKENTNFE